CEGPHWFTQKRPRTFLSELQSLAASEASKNQPPRDFRRCSIFDFCNSIGAKRTFVETLIPARCQEGTLAAQASILDLSSCRRGCRAADGNRTVRDERDAGGVEGVARNGGAPNDGRSVARFGTGCDAGTGCLRILSPRW